MDTWEWPAELDEFLEYCVEARPSPLVFLLLHYGLGVTLWCCFEFPSYFPWQSTTISEQWKVGA